jgi:hypothetical protein
MDGNLLTLTRVQIIDTNRKMLGIDIIVETHHMDEKQENQK